MRQRGYAAPVRDPTFLVGRSVKQNPCGFSGTDRARRGPSSAGLAERRLRRSCSDHSLFPSGRPDGPLPGAAYLLLPNFQFFLQTHRHIGLVFAIQQAWVAVVFLARRTPRTVSRRPLDWVAAYAGWFTSFLVRPGGYHPTWRIAIGFGVQMAGLLLWAWAFAKLARS
jgi:hypothetical protein